VRLPRSRGSSSSAAAPGKDINNHGGNEDNGQPVHRSRPLSILDLPFNFNAFPPECKTSWLAWAYFKAMPGPYEAFKKWEMSRSPPSQKGELGSAVRQKFTASWQILYIVGLVNSFGFFLETSMAAKSFFLSTLQGLEMEIPRTAPSPAAEKLT
jgi:hypothetical protein